MRSSISGWVVSSPRVSLANSRKRIDDEAVLSAWLTPEAGLAGEPELSQHTDQPFQHRGSYTADSSFECGVISSRITVDI